MKSMFSIHPMYFEITISEKASKEEHARSPMFTFSHQNFSFCLMVVALSLTERTLVYLPCRFELKSFNSEIYQPYKRDTAAILVRATGKIKQIPCLQDSSIIHSLIISKTFMSTLPRFNHRTNIM